ncbi:DUF397 domain-containing protein [Streptomyces sp. SID12501]|uniref:DUF397 domain-containing protein n=1 Tax=Streptomyces sp. SID12501 TaxID=2706042 RepID=A0A6B3BYB7_9ACTN|nr:DUF397 domain-containing protein [Streptomyces sp. SID12501]
MPDFQFRKSSYSDDKDECVEIATNIPTTIAIRDSKTPTSQPLHVHPSTWETFRTAVTDDRLR